MSSGIAIALAGCLAVLAWIHLPPVFAARGRRQLVERSLLAAERCLLIDLQQTRGKELPPYLDVFAQENHLTQQKSHPLVPRYERSDGDAFKLRSHTEWE